VLLMKRRADTPQSVTGRALSILGVFGPDHPALTLSEMSERTGLPVTTTFRLLGEFVECGGLVRDVDRRYRNITWTQTSPPRLSTWFGRPRRFSWLRRR